FVIVRSLKPLDRFSLLPCLNINTPDQHINITEISFWIDLYYIRNPIQGFLILTCIQKKSGKTCGFTPGFAPARFGFREKPPCAHETFFSLDHVTTLPIFPTFILQRVIFFSDLRWQGFSFGSGVWFHRKGKGSERGQSRILHIYFVRVAVRTALAAD